MYNTIKKIRMENVYISLCRDNDEFDFKLDKICADIEEMPEFNSLFFYSNKDRTEYYYQANEEQQIKDFLSKHMDVSKIKRCFIEIGEEMYECSSSDEISIGKIDIDESDFYEVLKDEFLKDDEYVDRLVNAKENFEVELNNIKKECLVYLVEIEIGKIENELEKFSF